MRVLVSLAALSSIVYSYGGKQANLAAAGFTVPRPSTCARTSRTPSSSSSSSFRENRALSLSLSTAGNDDGVDDDERDEFVTKEMLMRDMLADPQVKRKKKNGRYRTMDNRDSLPFVVQVATPEPYTSNDDMKKEARKNTKRAAKRKGGGSGKARKNLVGMDTPGSKDGIASSIYSRAGDGSLHRVLGEFKLDKNTNCGDLLEVEDREFEVQKARCQYKYVGGRRFIMVRKILEVKEVTRIAEESFIKRQFEKSKSEDDSVPPLE